MRGVGEPQAIDTDSEGTDSRLLQSEGGQQFQGSRGESG